MKNFIILLVFGLFFVSCGSDHKFTILDSDSFESTVLNGPIDTILVVPDPTDVEILHIVDSRGVKQATVIDYDRVSAQTDTTLVVFLVTLVSTFIISGILFIES